jgi:hypothetical protein
MNKPIKEIKGKNATLKIYQDELASNPREEFDNFSKMVFFHKRYKLPNDINLNDDQFDSWQEMKEYLEKEENAYIIYPVSILDHSGITVKIGSFNDRWDSGQIGFIYCTKEDIVKEYGELNEKNIETAKTVLKSELQLFDDYLTGNVYGYVLTKTVKAKDEDGEEFTREKEIDSCWGFYGDNFKEMFELSEEYQDIIDQL